MIEPFLDLSVPMPDKNTKQPLENSKSETPKNASECSKLLQKHLKEHGMYTCLETDAELSPSSDSLENCLKLFTSLDILDEDNKFICDKCTDELRKKQSEVSMWCA